MLDVNKPYQKLDLNKLEEQINRRLELLWFVQANFYQRYLYQKFVELREQSKS